MVGILYSYWTMYCYSGRSDHWLGFSCLLYGDLIPSRRFGQASFMAPLAHSSASMAKGHHSGCVASDITCHSHGSPSGNSALHRQAVRCKNGNASRANSAELLLCLSVRTSFPCCLHRLRLLNHSEGPREKR